MSLFKRPGGVPSLSSDELFMPTVIDGHPDERDEYLDTAPYDEAVQDAYVFARDAIEAIILHGHLPRQKQNRNMFHQGISAEKSLPPIDEYADDILDLMPWYEHMQKVGMGPEPVFVPKGLNLHEWDALQQGHPVPYDNVRRIGEITVVNSRYRFPREGWEGPIEAEETAGVETNWFIPDGRQVGSYDPLADLDGLRPDDERAWELALISGKNAPAVTGISSDASLRRSRARELRSVMGVTGDLDDEAAVALLSPRWPIYNALQWKRMAQGIVPVDMVTRTILRENLSETATCSAAWHEDVAGVFLGSELASEGYQTIGLRPTVRTGELGWLSLAAQD